MRRVVGRNAHRHTVTHDDADFEALHVSTKARRNHDTILKSDFVVSTAGGVGNLAFESNEIVFRQASFPESD